MIRWHCGVREPLDDFVYGYAEGTGDDSYVDSIPVQGG